ncbi:endo alpha-1,4 polygalactosaminidase [Aspergillus lucknowensis]|uniref:alpha-galactosidase n=1 Tax=Aspergillus lucknowensis TaxID=176173 RepID=A0ABR4LS32_9EURO
MNWKKALSALAITTIPGALTYPTTNNLNTATTNLAPREAAGIWQPAIGATWQIVLKSPLTDLTADVDILDIDLFDNPKSTIDTQHSHGRKRPDSKAFKGADLGDKLDKWTGERWVDLRSRRIRAIMGRRLDLALSKGCDGIDPDNIDAYNNENEGLDLQEGDSVDFVNWLAGEAHARGLAIGLKNGRAIIPAVMGEMQWSVNEQCAEYGECEAYSAFVEGGKPVFHIEYPKGDLVNDEEPVGEDEKEMACWSFEHAEMFSTLIKNMDLDHLKQEC